MINHLKINLLPPETLEEEFKKAKFYKIQTAGIVIIFSLTFLASLTVVLRILQSRNIPVVQAQVTQAKQQVSDLKNTQASLLLLQDRLKVINQYLGVPSQQSSMYKLIDKLIPPSVLVNAVTVSKGGEVVFMALVPNFQSLDELINNLTAKDINGGKINQVSIESLNRGRDGIYRVSFKIKSS